MKNNHVSLMGFARYEKRVDVETEELIEACLNWRSRFLLHQNGIIHHFFLGNLKGQFADAIFAVDRDAYSGMVQNYAVDEHSKSLRDLLKQESICLTSVDILKDNFKLPDQFSCMEFGTFRPTRLNGFSEESLVDISEKIEREYLVDQESILEHFVGVVDSNTYSEVAFAKSLGAARRTCSEYMSNPVCKEMLAMFDPNSVDLDFWYLLA